MLIDMNTIQEDTMMFQAVTIIRHIFMNKPHTQEIEDRFFMLKQCGTPELIDLVESILKARGMLP